jgi:hypothetical protein
MHAMAKGAQMPEEVRRMLADIEAEDRPAAPAPAAARTA